MAEVAISMVTALLPLVTKAIADMRKLGKNAEAELTELKKNLELTKAFLRDTETTSSNAGVVGVWLKQLQDITVEVKPEVAEAVNIADQIANRRNLFKRLIACIRSAPDSVQLGSKVNSINQKLKNVLDRATIMGPQNTVTFGSSSVEETAIFLGDSAQVVPRDADVSKVVDMLINCSSTNCSQSLPVASIVGMAGLGKSTLAKMVLKDHRLRRLVEKRQQLWVCVSATFDIDKILCEIMEELTRKPATSFETLKRPAIVGEIKEKLEGKPFLLVLDDVWNEDVNKWYQLMASLSEIHHDDKSIILATTRSQEVVLAMQSPPKLTHQISMLDDDKCWSIIKTKSFGTSLVPPSLEVIGKDITKKCKGVALVASIIGGTMRIRRSEEAWSSIKESHLWNSLGSDNEIISVLGLSYDRLGSESLKKCFEFCSIFPEDSFLYREELIKLWTAAGFLDSTMANDHCSQTAWDIGNDNFNTLVSNSLFQDVEKDDYYGNIVRCKMHDSVRALARSRTKAIALTSDMNSSIDVSSIPHLNIIGVESKQAERLIIEGNALQSLFCGIDTFNSISEKCKGLKILKLVGPGSKLPSSVGDLKDLRYFDVTETAIKKLPEPISKLQKLQTLNVRGCVCLEGLPEDIEKLVELSHLEFNSEGWVPLNIGSLSSLQTLPYFNVGVEEGRGIEELGRLSHLQGALEVVNLEHVRCKEKAREAKLSEKKGLYELRLKWNMSTKDRVVDEDVLEGLQPHLNLKGLQITGYMGIDFPTWLPSMTMKNNSRLSVQKLVKLVLQACSNCEKLPSLGHLPNLTYLQLQKMDSVKTIGADFYGGGNFPSLKVFEIHQMKSLKEWVETTDENMFPSLEKLFIQQCSNLTGVSLRKGYPCLKNVQIAECNQISRICLEDGLPSLQLMSIRDCEELSHLGDGLASKELQRCTALQTLQLKFCPKMFPRLDFLERLESLVTLVIERCGINYSLGDIAEQGLDRVTHLEQVELEAEQLPYFLTYLHPSLESLTLFGNSETKCLPDQMQRLTALRTLRLYNFDGLEALPLWFDHLSSLDELRIWRCWNLRSISPLKAMRKLKYLELPVGGQRGSEGLLPPLFDTIHQCIPSSLQRLTLLGYYGEPFSTLPPQIQHMTTLKELKLHSIPRIKALPEWLQNLSSLQQLVISWCPELEYLPNLSNLNLSLKILGCTKLAGPSGYFNASYADWCKISFSITNAPSSS